MENPNSILETIKKLLSITPDYKAFDTDIVVHINSAFLTLNDLGVGPAEPFEIIDESETWQEFFGDKNLSSVKTYIYLKVRLAFDPPQTSFAIEAMERQAAEHAWRLNVRAEGAYENMPVSTPEPSPLPY